MFYTIRKMKQLQFLQRIYMGWQNFMVVNLFQPLLFCPPLLYGKQRIYRIARYVPFGYNCREMAVRKYHRSARLLILRRAITVLGA